jgi:thiol:disulfide interchange protein
VRHEGETMRAGAVTRGGWPGILLIWAISVAGAIVVVALAYAGTADWFDDSTPLGVYGALGVVFAASVLGALAVQLASRRPDGFVTRASASVGGAAVIVALATLVVAPVAMW